MFIFPAIDLFEGKAVRLYKGDYAQMTVYHNDPLAVARDFKAAGATHLHVVDLEGARSGETPNIDTVAALAANSGLFTEVGGGIRSIEVVERYLNAGVSRVILGTAAVLNWDFLRAAVARYGDKIAVGVDIKDGKVAIKGWVETSALDPFTFCQKLQDVGVRTVICTDVSKDGAMQGTNRALYRELSAAFSLDFVASGGVSTIEDVAHLASLGMYGAIIGKAYYMGALSLAQAIEVAVS